MFVQEMDMFAPSVETMLVIVPDVLQIMEGNTGTMSGTACIMLDSAVDLERDINLVLNTVPMTASEHAT
jgi:hypothetical protein